MHQTQSASALATAAEASARLKSFFDPNRARCFSQSRSCGSRVLTWCARTISTSRVSGSQRSSNCFACTAQALSGAAAPLVFFAVFAETPDLAGALGTLAEPDFAGGGGDFGACRDRLLLDSETARS